MAQTNLITSTDWNIWMNKYRCVSTCHRPNILVDERMVSRKARVGKKPSQQNEGSNGFFWHMYDIRMYIAESKFATWNDILFDVVTSFVNKYILGSEYTTFAQVLSSSLPHSAGIWCSWCIEGRKSWGSFHRGKCFYQQISKGLNKVDMRW